MQTTPFKAASLDVGQAIVAAHRAHSSAMLESTALSPPIAPKKQQFRVEPSQSGIPPDFNVLDQEDEWVAFSRPDPDDKACWQSSLVIEGMHCAACAFTIENALNQVPGVRRARVSGASHRAQIVWERGVTQPSDWFSAIQAVGYRAVPANDTFSVERRKVESRKALWRWLVAALCMMQVMMYAYPAYVAQPGDLTAEMEQLLRWASWVLTLPVVFFSCGPFFKAALRDLRLRQVSMDLPVALGIVITFIGSTVGTFEPDGPFGHEVYFDSLTMFVFFLLTGRWLELRMRDRTAGALESLMNQLPDSVERQLPSGEFVRVAARTVAVGDVIRIFAGQAFPADGRLIFGETTVNEALMTGESRPLQRGPGAPILCGSQNLSGTVHIQVEKIGDLTQFSQIVALMGTAATTKPHSAVLADRVARPFLIGVLLIAFMSGAWWWSHDPGHALMVAVAVLVVTCPCALSLATPAAMLASAGSLARGGVLVRRLNAFEVLSKVDAVVFDKTGTLTLDRMSLRHVAVRSGTALEVVTAQAKALARHSLHPVSLALAVSESAVQTGDAITFVCEAAEETAGAGVSGFVMSTGSPATGMQLRLGSAAFCDVADELRDERSLVAYLADGQGWLATFEFDETVRPDVNATISILQKSGVSVQVLSGDNPRSTNAVAERAGIDHARGGCSPNDKLKHIQALQAAGRTVAMVGDGLNDGPVLAGADVSFAFGSAVPLAQAQADFVVLGSHLMSVAETLVRAKQTMKIVRQNLWWALAYNITCVPLALLGYMPAWLAGLGMATSSLLVVLNAMRLAQPLTVEN